MTAAGAPGPRMLLRRLREIMAGEGSAQERLDAVTRLIATDMVAEVCSVYLRRAGDLLELFSTQGLRAEAVHQTRLRVGEGLIGDIAANARPLMLTDAQAHPQFAYRPETGEEIFHSLLGVPLQRGGRVVGVLAVQNRTKREYTLEEAEALQTVAMVLAELVSGGDLIAPDEVVDIDGNATLPLRCDGLCLAEGIAHGTVFVHRGPVQIRDLVAEDPDTELERLAVARDDLSQGIRALIDNHASVLGEAHRDILDAYRMFAEDRGWYGRMVEAVRGGLTAEGAVRRVQEENRRRLEASTSPHLRDRLTDLEDLSNRLLGHLVGETGDRPAELPEAAVLVAKTLGPAELLEYDYRRLRGVVLGEGSPTSHVVLIARSLDIPVVGRVGAALERLVHGDPVIVDGWNGVVHIRPDEAALEDLQEIVATQLERRRAYAVLKDEPSRTADGVEVELHLNAGLMSDLPLLDETGAKGIGLFRTELHFMARRAYPSVEEQTMVYAQVLDAAGERPVVFRTLDLGGEKLLPHLERTLEREENPAMGWRALRVGLDRPAVLRNQLRAMLQAANGRPLSIMFPMVAELSEFRRARQILELERQRWTDRGGATPRALKVGVMLEVPSLIWQLDPLLEEVDFVSIGTNDLAQYLFASDRTNPRLATRYDTLAPGLISLISHVVERAEAHGTPLAVCGDMAARPLEAICLVAIGVRNLSLPAASLGPVKAAIRGLDCASFSAYVRSLRDSADHTIRDYLRNFAQDHGFIH